MCCLQIRRPTRSFAAAEEIPAPRKARLIRARFRRISRRRIDFRTPAKLAGPVNCHRSQPRSDIDAASGKAVVTMSHQTAGHRRSQSRRRERYERPAGLERGIRRAGASESSELDSEDVTFEWDGRKSAANLKKHHVAFQDAATVFLEREQYEEGIGI